MLRYNIPDATSSEVVADWIELYVTYLKDSISKSQIASYIQASEGSDPEDGFIDSVWNVLACRVELYGSNPPIEVQPLSINSLIDWEQYPEYLACLIYALEGNPNTSSTSAAKAGKYFERISNEAIKNYIKGNSLIYGFPTEQNIQTIADNFLKEKFNYLPPAYRKDRDLDIIAWKDWEDNRASQIILFIQCAAGSNWKGKIKDLNMRAWEKYIHFAASPIKGFSVPVVISDKEKLHEISTDAGLIIDRPRIYKQTFQYEFKDIDLRPILLNWCKNRIAEINN
ncbi:MAG: hypothetical protein HY840_13395 [Bacteroidetes bacterium]|nr:hypothetical protein [Bacteroidota bacterium]